MNRTATMFFICGKCQEETQYMQELTLDKNTTDVICSHCGEQYHISFTVLSFEPFNTCEYELSHTIGILKDGKFFDKAQLS